MRSPPLIIAQITIFDKYFNNIYKLLIAYTDFQDFSLRPTLRLPVLSITSNRAWGDSGVISFENMSLNALRARKMKRKIDTGKQYQIQVTTKTEKPLTIPIFRLLL